MVCASPEGTNAITSLTCAGTGWAAAEASTARARAAPHPMAVSRRVLTEGLPWSPRRGNRCLLLAPLRLGAPAGGVAPVVLSPREVLLRASYATWSLADLAAAAVRGAFGAADGIIDWS